MTMRTPEHNLKRASETSATGRMGEDAAAEYLAAQGMQILGRNVRVGHNEIDILARDKDEIVFAEVRTRSENWMMTPEQSVGPRKLAHLITAGQEWTERNNYDGFWRVDLVSVTISHKQQVNIKHIRGITEPIV